MRGQSLTGDWGHLRETGVLILRPRGKGGRGVTRLLGGRSRVGEGGEFVGNAKGGVPHWESAGEYTIEKEGTRPPPWTCGPGVPYQDSLGPRPLDCPPSVPGTSERRLPSLLGTSPSRPPVVQVFGSCPYTSWVLEGRPDHPHTQCC